MTRYVFFRASNSSFLFNLTRKIIKMHLSFRCTKCLKESKCPSKFYELTLNIKGNKTIQDCLNEYLKKEILDGDNKYSCANCGDKQDAERFISIKELPPVLNLQLMRFYYDM